VAAGPEADRIRFGLLPVVDTLPLLAGVEKRFFSEEGIELEPVSFQSALERDAALQAGKLDGYFGDILNTVLLIHAGQPIKILTTAYHSQPAHRMFGIAAAPDSGIRRLVDLQGRQVAVSRATIIEYLLDRFLEAHRLPTDFVQQQEIKKIPVRLQMLLAGQVPAALLPEPLLTLAESRGAAVLADDRNLDTSLTVLALNLHLLSESETLAERFLRAYGRAVQAVNSNPQNFKNFLVERTRFPTEIKDRYRVPDFPPVAPPPAADIQAAQQWLKAKGLVKAPLAYDAVVLQK
jgi:NitT/TauT family transport system substrate-binding protein